MYLVYQPEGSDEPQRFKYLPNKLMAADRELLERKTGRNYRQFTADVADGNSLCRRALLFMFLRRDHRGLSFDDVDFAWDELTLEYSRGELQRMRAEVEANAPADARAAALEKIDEQIAEAYDEESEGKASLPIAE
ncbi:hypothetical protein [Streptomyces synnematoformans]|uniref:hypothetical protein n=1 Tax=Streptomyces synnematoformans TaxID=415721 RepID=UPI0031E1F807